VAKKVLLIVFGAVLALIGAGLTVGGAVLLALTSGDGYFGTDTETLRTPTRALVSEPQVLQHPDGGGFEATVRLRATATSGEPVFLGVGPTAEVDRYFAGSSYDEVQDVEFSPFRYATLRHEGERELPPPADQPLWTAQATGSGEQTLEIRVGAGDYRVVVMNADAAEGVEVRASFGIRVPFLRRLGIGLLVGGVLGLLVGVLLLVLGLRTKVPPRQPPWTPYGPGYGPGYAPGQPPGYPPGYGPGQPPGYGPGQAPGYGPGQAPGYAPGQDPGQAPGWGPPGYAAPPPAQPSPPPGHPPPPEQAE
jgi:hypothetical protein